jgi:hypothetical protein
VSGNRRYFLDSRYLPKNLLNPLACGRGSLERRRLRQRQISEKVTLILGWNETSRNLSTKPTRRDDGEYEEQNANEAATHQQTTDRDITVGCGSKYFVKAFEEKAQWSSGFLSGSQEEGGKRRA